MNGGMSPSGYTFKWNTAENTIVISEGGNSCGFVNYMTQKFWRGGHCYEVDTKMDKKFLYQLLKFKEKLIMSLRVGSGLPNIQKNRIESLSLVIPNQEDQIAIAQVLSDMDAEVESLERKLEKCKILKQGMMQELLTGKVRLNHR
jgi:type I restriction enzyme S subunit